MCSRSAALATAEMLPRESALQLVAHARAAFMAGVRVAMLIAALVTAASAILVYVRIGRLRGVAQKDPAIGPCENA